MTNGMSLITFDVRDVEDRLKSNAAGHYVGRDIDVALVTPVGGKLTHEQEVTEDLLRRWKNKPEEKYCYDAYMAWKEGVEPPVNGSDLKLWPPISPSQLKSLNSRNIRSVEELAELPDEYLPSFGPGFRGIRDKARDWLKSSSDIGQIVAQVSLLKEEVERLKEANEKKDVLIKGLTSQLDKKKTPKEAA